MFESTALTVATNTEASRPHPYPHPVPCPDGWPKYGSLAWHWRIKSRKSHIHSIWRGSDARFFVGNPNEET